MATWLNADEAAEHVNLVRGALSAGYAGCSERTIRSWVARGHLTPNTDTGRQLFALADVAAAELATRARALRLVGIGST